MTTAERPIVAAFDVDGTLTTRDCVVPFLQRVSGSARLLTRIAARPAALAGAAIRRDRDRLKAMAMRAAFTGRATTAVEAVGTAFAEHVHRSWLRPDTPRRLAWHQDEGHRVVLVSASLGAYLYPLADLLGVEDVLCTEAVVGDDGRYTGAMVGANCRGPEKVRRLRSWMADAGLADATLWAYGDSAGDRELLACADRALLVKDIIVPRVPVGAP